MNETKRLTGYSYKLMGLGNIPGLPAQEQANQFGLDVPFGPDDLEIDENQMSCVIPFADGNRVDGSGDVIEVAGIKTERHRANPIVLFDHGKQVTLPVALSEDPITKLYTVEIDPIAKKAKGKAFFYQGKWGGKNFNGATEYDHALFCEQLFDLLAKRYIRAGSIGYQVMKGLPMQGTYGMGIPQGVHLQEVNMLEYSAVVLPCNQDTVGKALSLRRVCGKPLSSHLVKSLSPYAPPRKVQMGYEGKSEDLPKRRLENQTKLEETNNQIEELRQRWEEAQSSEERSRLADETVKKRREEWEPLEIERQRLRDQKSANIQQMQNARQQMRQETPPQKKQQVEESQRTNKGQKALTPEERTTQNIDREQAIRDLIAFLSEDSSKAGGGAAKYDAPYLVQTAKEPIEKIRKLSKALTPEDEQEIERLQNLQNREHMVQEELDKIGSFSLARSRSQEAENQIRNIRERAGEKSLSALLKSLRAKYRKNYDIVELEGNMKSHPQKDDPYDLDSQRIPPKESVKTSSWFPTDGDMEEDVNWLLDSIPGIRIREHPHGFDDEKALPVAKGESLFSIGSNVDFKIFSQEWRDWESEVRRLAGEQIPILNKVPNDEIHHSRDSTPVYQNTVTGDDIRRDLERNGARVVPDENLKVLPEALTFLKYLASEDSSLDESGRMKCYHYAKSLEQYGRKGDFSQTDRGGRQPLQNQGSTERHPFTGHYSPKATMEDVGRLVSGVSGLPYPSQETMRRYQGPNPGTEGAVTPRPTREHDNYYMDITSGGLEEETTQTPQVHPQEIPDWSDPLYLKSLERLIKMALPQDYEVGREVVHSFPPRQAGESEFHLRPSQSMRTAPREITDRPENARIVYGDESEGLGLLHNFTYENEAFPPEQEQEQ